MLAETREATSADESCLHGDRGLLDPAKVRYTCLKPVVIPTKKGKSESEEVVDFEEQLEVVTRGQGCEISPGPLRSVPKAECL